MVKGLEEELSARKAAAIKKDGAVEGRTDYNLPGPDNTSGRIVEVDEFRNSLLQQGAGSGLQRIGLKIISKIFKRRSS